MLVVMGVVSCLMLIMKGVVSCLMLIMMGVVSCVLRSLNTSGRVSSASSGLRFLLAMTVA